MPELFEMQNEINNKKTKKPGKFRFNALDLVICIIVLAAVGIGYYVIRGWIYGDGNKKIGIEFTVEVRGRLDEFADRVSVGDEVIDSISKKSLGRVSAVKREVYTEPVFIEETGELIMAEYPGRSTLFITIASEALDDGIGYAINDYRVNVGTPLYMRLPDFVCEGFCIVFETNGDDSAAN